MMLGISLLSEINRDLPLPLATHARLQRMIQRDQVARLADALVSIERP